MCAILSWVQSPLREEQGVTNRLLRELFHGAAQYGKHSVGLLTRRGAQEELFKKAITPARFLKNSNHRIERAALAEKGIGHTRYATHGPKVDRNAHPFF